MSFYKIDFNKIAMRRQYRYNERLKKLYGVTYLEFKDGLLQRLFSTFQRRTLIGDLKEEIKEVSDKQVVWDQLVKSRLLSSP